MVREQAEATSCKDTRGEQEHTWYWKLRGNARGLQLKGREAGGSRLRYLFEASACCCAWLLCEVALPALYA